MAETAETTETANNIADNDTGGAQILLLLMGFTYKLYMARMYQ